jgi:hypothetical protein
MDSFVYPALERLAAMGLIDSQVLAIRPWTRQECRRQVREAVDRMYGFASVDGPLSDGVRSEAERMLPDLEHFLLEPDGRSHAVLESVYVRAGTIAGPALTDGFHFDQTWWNDFGRPLGRGSSYIAGYTIRATSHRFFFFDRQELQTTPGSVAVTPTQSAFFNTLDNVYFGSTPPGFSLVSPAIAAAVRQRPLDLYAGLTFAGYNLGFGKREIFWGPTTMGPLSFSNNAEPFYNLNFTSGRPHNLPFFPNLGTFSVDAFFGKLSGHRYPARPYVNGQKIDFVFGRYLEMSATRWSIFLGVGHPMTVKNVLRNLFSANSTGSIFYDARDDPGDRKSGFDFRLHVPGLSDLITIYADGYADDGPNPLSAPRRNPWNPGIYLARLPGLPRVDLRFEVTSTEEMSHDEGGRRIYINNQYRDGNTNKGFLLGNVTGRDGRAFEGRLGFWQSSRTRLEGGYRQQKLSAYFLPSGGTVSDGFIRGSYALGKQWTAETFVQYERFLIPSDLAGRQSNVSARFQVLWNPAPGSYGFFR